MKNTDATPRPSFLALPLQSRLLGGRRTRIAVLVLGCVLIPVWQGSFAFHPQGLDRRYRLRSSAGIHHEARFVYFYYYLGLFPVVTEREDGLEYSREGARRLFEEQGHTLLTELGHTLRYGELGVTFLYLPGVLLAGTPEYLSLVPSHAIAWVAALMALFVAFWWVGQPVLGALLVVLLGSNPFQLHEVCGNENVFGWQITTAVWLLALHVPVLGLRETPRRFLWVVPVLSGLVVATVRQVRPEPVAMLLPALVCCGSVPRVRWRVRGALVGVLLVSFVVGSKGWQTYFGLKREQAHRRVAAVGGHPYPGPRHRYHMAWHSIWCGLGDFDRKHGYVWNDVVAARYARPILEQKHGLELPPWDGKSLVYENAFWDHAGKYYKTPYEVPHYGEVLRAKVLHDVLHDPLWYLGILARRAWRVLCETSPVRLALGRRWLELPMHGLVAIAVLALLLWRRCWPLAKVLCFSVPLSLTALLVYSGHGMCLYSCYHVLAAALVCAVALEGVQWGYRWRRARAARS